VSDDPKFDELIEREAKGYRARGVPPTERMWLRIEGDVARAIRRPRLSVARRWSWLAAGAGIAAALVVGIAIGRRTVTNDGTTRPPQVALTPLQADSARDAQMRAVTWSHLGQAEAFLTEVRADLKTGRDDPERSDRSRALLARTRLIMANDASRTPSVDRLLQDLELVLAEIAALPDSGMRRSIDVRLLDERLSAGTVLPRIRTILPSPPAIGGA
jgi:hypothetical protein